MKFEKSGKGKVLVPKSYWDDPYYEIDRVVHQGNLLKGNHTKTGQREGIVGLYQTSRPVRKSGKFSNVQIPDFRFFYFPDSGPLEIVKNPKKKLKKKNFQKKKFQKKIFFSIFFHIFFFCLFIW